MSVIQDMRLDDTYKGREAFSELLADMIRTMESTSWTGGDLRNAALDHLGIMHPFAAVR
jgi:hypothetical protein